MKLISTFILTFLLSGCFIFGDPVEFDETTGQTPQWILSRGEAYASNNDWPSAIRILEKGEQRYPNSKLAPQFKLDLAYSYYRFSQDAEAIAMLDKFIRLYPNHPTVDYAFYLKGVVLFIDRGIMDKLTLQDISDRDVAPLKDSFKAFEIVVKRYPDSKYYDDCIIRMTYLMNKMAENEIHVARYYMIRKAYLAALNRAQFVLEEYPQTIHQEEALIIMISAYEFLGIQDLQKDTERFLKYNYPNSKFHTKDLQAQKKDWWNIWDSLYD
jgi:outer membrane protein assembly factor BamD